jgi:hypothetical protein
LQRQIEEKQAPAVSYIDQVEREHLIAVAKQRLNDPLIVWIQNHMPQLMNAGDLNTHNAFMQELERLQRNSGAMSARDFEWVLQAVGAALPAGQSISNLDYQVQGNGETRLQGLQLTEAQNSEFAKALRNQGLDAQLNGAQWRIVGMKAGF